MRKIALVVLAAALAVPVAASAREFRVLYSNLAGTPIGTLIDSAGRVYLPTYGGGKHERGTILRLDGDPQVKVLYDFRDKNGPAYPSAPLLRSPTGAIFGIASRIQGDNYGTTVFELNHGTETTLHFFGDGRSALGGPQPGLVMDAAGNLYGATAGGGDSEMGTVFKIAPGGETTVLHTFSGLDGKWPQGDLMLDAGGNMLGTTFAGGSEDCGTVFRIAADGTFAQLHSFDAAAEGCQIWGGLTADGSGNLYGTTNYAGPKYAGTVFKLNTKGKLFVLHAFPQNGGDGERPQGTMVRDAKGNLYGTTQQGGGVGQPMQSGTVFKVAPNGKTTILHAFGSGLDGAMPIGNLTMDAAGNLYGTTLYGANLFEITR